MMLDTGYQGPNSTTYPVLYINGDTSDFKDNSVNNFASSSLVVNNVSQYPNKLEVYEGITYIFDKSHSSNQNYVLDFSTTTPTNVILILFKYWFIIYN